MAGGLRLGERIGDATKGLRAVFATVFVVSLAYSIVRTETDQAFTYFDTTARLWEFSIGALLAVFPDLRVGTKSQGVLSWLGIFLIVSCGALLGVATEFPGYIALWPSGAAALILIAGSTPATPLSATRLLGSKWLSGFGDISYAFYLWHWPLLIVLKDQMDVERLDLSWGLGLMAVSAALAYVTTHYFEVPARRTQLAVDRPFRFGAYCLLPNLILLAAFAIFISAERSGGMRPSAYLGAQAVPLGKAEWSKQDLPIKPGLLDVKEDRPAVYTDGCHQKQKKAELLSCVYGEPGAKKTIAVVGGSHSAHWLPALRLLAKKHHFKIVTYTKSSCRFGIAPQSSRDAEDERLSEVGRSCGQWNDRLMAELTRSKPSYVFTTATSRQDRSGSVPESFFRAWEKLERLGIPVLAMRDNPWFGFDVPECIEKAKQDVGQCQRKRSEVLKPGTPLSARELQRENVTYLDLSRYFCPDETCPAVIGNVLVYRDKHHLTTVYAESLTFALEEELLRKGVQL